jgi:NAD(P)-dependent dehydrogenase (short-subunit alcohol dehydrogenase family)
MPSPSLSTTWAHFHPPKPKFTDRDVPDLAGRVCIVTGSNTGIGKEVARILYSKNARVYVAARNEDKARAAIQDIKDSTPSTPPSTGAGSGSLEFLPLDLADLHHVRTAAQTFLSKENRLDILFNNAGVMVSSSSSSEPLPRTPQGHELSLGVNCIGMLLFTQLLTPLLTATARSPRTPLGSVRVVWLSSFALELFAHDSVGVSLDNLDYHIPKPGTERYGVSKVGVWALAVEYARRYKGEGIVSVPINPGNLTSELPRHQGVLLKTVARLVGYPPLLGAYTELWAAFSGEVTLERSGEWGECCYVYYMACVCEQRLTLGLQLRRLGGSTPSVRICTRPCGSNPRGGPGGLPSSGSGSRARFSPISRGEGVSGIECVSEYKVVCFGA